MHPPWSMIVFTTLAGAAQGLVLALFGVEVARAIGRVATPPGLIVAGCALAVALGAAGLVSASFHLGRPLRAWRAASQWRTSWLSREVIVLPAFLAATAAWGFAHWSGAGWRHPAGALAAVLALGLYGCTAMIYGCIRAMRAWHHPLTVVNFTLIGLASGGLLALALVSAWSDPAAERSPLPLLAKATLVLVVAAALTRAAALRRNLGLAARPATTIQSALGIRHPKIVQTAQGFVGGNFNTREFFHDRSAATVRGARWAAALLGFALPAAVVAAALLARAGGGGWALPATLAAAVFALHALGVLAERWSFFVEAEHTQNLYHLRRD